eukprot:SAG11_NODE_4965_length_1708_cov_4.415786_2_plen_266_part_00
MNVSAGFVVCATQLACFLSKFACTPKGEYVSPKHASHRIATHATKHTNPLRVASDVLCDLLVQGCFVEQVLGAAEDEALAGGVEVAGLEDAEAADVVDLAKALLAALGGAVYLCSALSPRHTVAALFLGYGALCPLLLHLKCLLAPLYCLFQRASFCLLSCLPACLLQLLPFLIDPLADDLGPLIVAAVGGLQVTSQGGDGELVAVDDVPGVGRKELDAVPVEAGVMVPPGVDGGGLCFVILINNKGSELFSLLVASTASLSLPS